MFILQIGKPEILTLRLRRIFALCVDAGVGMACLLVHLMDGAVAQECSMIMFAVLLRLELHPHPEVGQRSQDLKRHQHRSRRIAAGDPVGCPVCGLGTAGHYRQPSM